MAAEAHRSPETTTAAVIQATRRKPVRDHEPDRSMLAARASVPTTPQMSAVRDPDIHNPSQLIPSASPARSGPLVRRKGAREMTATGPASAASTPYALASSIVAVARRREAQAG